MTTETQAPDPAPAPEPTAFVHWPLNGPPRLVWYSNKALHDAIEHGSKARNGYVPDLKLYAAIPAPEGADPAAWLVTWKGEKHEYAHAHASELPAVDQARIMGGKCEPLYRAAPAPQAAELTKAQVDAIWESPTPQGTGKSRYDLARELIAAAQALRPAPAEVDGLPQLPEFVAEAKRIVRRVSDASYTQGIDERHDSPARDQRNDDKVRALLGEAGAAIDRLAALAAKKPASKPPVQGSQS